MSLDFHMLPDHTVPPILSQYFLEGEEKNKTQKTHVYGSKPPISVSVLPRNISEVCQGCSSGGPSDLTPLRAEQPLTLGQGQGQGQAVGSQGAAKDGATTAPTRRTRTHIFLHVFRLHGLVGGIRRVEGAEDQPAKSAEPSAPHGPAAPRTPTASALGGSRSPAPCQGAALGPRRPARTRRDAAAGDREAAPAPRPLSSPRGRNLRPHRGRRPRPAGAPRSAPAPRGPCASPRPGTHTTRREMIQETMAAAPGSAAAGADS